jgi:ABC-type nitrate/sulfonate/bicarbonate transport system substrate-binding protein
MNHLGMRLAAALSGGLLVATLGACGGGSTVDDDASGGGGGTAPPLVTVDAGYVSAVDQLGLPIALEIGAFEEQGLDVRLADPFPTGVDSLNALQAGDVDFVQVGTPAIGAAQRGLDLVLLGNYSGSASKRAIDDTMAVVARPGSGISGADLTTLRGKRIGVSVGSINHLYLIGLLQELQVPVGEVEIVNTAPPDMPVALQTSGIDAAIVWDPWPITIRQQVPGSEEVVRGGGYIPYVGYIVALREFVEQNPDVVERFLTARAAADKWMRDNPEDAAEAATRWLPGTELAVAQEAMQYNVAQLDPRFSACNYVALDTVAQMLAEQGVTQPGFTVGDRFLPGPITSVAAGSPDLFEDLPPIPDAARVDDGFSYDRDAALAACPAT